MKTGAAILVAVLLGGLGSLRGQSADQPAPINRDAPHPRAAAPVRRIAPPAGATARPAVQRTTATTPRSFPMQPRPNVIAPRPTNFPRTTTPLPIAPRSAFVNPDLRPHSVGNGGGDYRLVPDRVTAEQWRQWRNRDRGNVANGDANAQTAWRNRNTNPGERNGTDWRTRNNNPDWRNRNGNYGGLTWDEACRRYDHHHHDRGWWRRHYPHIVLIGTGYYYWDSGWWYPAWGYDPYYSSYAYDGPLYGGDYDVSPEQTIADVQAALQASGYYFGAVDGQLGPLTRQALAAWQRDHGLAVTTVIDPATLRSLGI